MIYFFTKGSINVPGPRRRVFYLSQYLDRVGYQSRVKVVVARPWWNLSAARWHDFYDSWRIYSQIKKTDIIYLHRPIYQVDFIFITLFFRIFFNKKYIFDFDDPIFLHSPVKVWLMVKLAKQVVVAGHFLSDYASKLNPRVRIIPMLVDTEVATLPHQQSLPGPINIGWVGDGNVHLENLKLVAEILQQVQISGLDFIFTLIGAKGRQEIYELFSDDKYQSRIIDWLSPEDVGKEISLFDIALMPMYDTLWNRGKCPIKNIEYMQCGTPTIASDVGEAHWLINDGEDGLLVSNNPDNWAQAIRQLANDPSQRLLMGEKAKRKIDREYSYKQRVKDYFLLFEEYLK